MAGENFPRGTTNQKHYPGLGNDTSSVWNICALPQTSFREENTGGLAKRRLFLMLFKILAYADCLEPGKDTGLLPWPLFVHHQERLRVKEILMPYGSNEQQTEEVLQVK